MLKVAPLFLFLQELVKQRSWNDRLGILINLEKRVCLHPFMLALQREEFANLVSLADLPLFNFVYELDGLDYWDLCLPTSRNNLQINQMCPWVSTGEIYSVIRPKHMLRFKIQRHSLESESGCSCQLSVF